MFAIIVDIAGELKRRGHANPSGLAVYAQEPQYRSVEVEFVSRKCVAKLEMRHPRRGLNVAEEHLGLSTLLFEYCILKDEQTCRALLEAGIGMRIGTGSDILAFGGQKRQQSADKYRKGHFDRPLYPGCVGLSTNLDEILSGLTAQWPKPKEQHQLDLDRPSDEEGSLQQLQWEYRNAMSVWQDSSCREELLAIVDERNPASGRQFNKVVCIAPGSFSWPIEGRSDASTTRSMPQLVCTVDLADYLKKKDQGSNIEVLAQDLMYTVADMEFLISVGVTVLEMDLKPGEPNNLCKAKYHLSPRTLVIEFGMVTYELCQPDVGMLIGSGSHGLRERAFAHPMWQPDILYADHFDARYTSVVFPHCEEFDALRLNKRIYWRRPQAANPGRGALRVLRRLLCGLCGS